MKKNEQTLPQEQIPLEDAFLLLENSVAVIVDDNLLVYPCVSSLIGEDDHDFLFLDYGQEDTVFRFSEGDNKTVTLDGDYMVLVATSRNAYRLQLLQKRQLGQPELKYTLKYLRKNQ